MGGIQTGAGQLLRKLPGQQGGRDQEEGEKDPEERRNPCCGRHHMSCVKSESKANPSPPDSGTQEAGQPAREAEGGSLELDPRQEKGRGSPLLPSPTTAGLPEVSRLVPCLQNLVELEADT